MAPDIRLTDPPDPAARSRRPPGKRSTPTMWKKTGIADYRPIGCVATDPTSGKIIGGLWGRTEIGLLFLDMFYLPEAVRGSLDMFYLPEAVRGSGVGSRLIEAVETEARRRGCRQAVVETSSFQAPGFYLRHGYEGFGRVASSVADHARIFLRKKLA